MPKRATYRDVLDAPQRMVAEVVAGALHMQPRPAKRLALAKSGPGMKIGPPFNYGDGGPGGWLIIDEPELHLGEDIVVPDMAGWRSETMSEENGGSLLHSGTGLGLRGAFAIDPAV